MMKVVYGTVGGLLALILFLTIVGQASIIALINTGLTGICNSGWPLASLFNPSGGIVPLVLVVGFFIGAIALGVGVGQVTGHKK